MLNILLVSANYPDDFHLWAQWNRRANLAISKVDNVKTNIVAPRPYSLPFKFFPHHEMCKVPIKEKKEEGMIHHPRFLYVIPKRFFYGWTGNFYRHSISKYVFKNIKKQDIIHSHHVYPDGYGIIPACKKWNAPLVVDIHGDFLFIRSLDVISIRKKIMETLNFSNKIICISKNIYSLAKKAGVDEGKLEHIPLGVDISKFKPRDKEEIRQEFSIKEQKIILYVGQLIERKGIKYLLKAVSQIDGPHRKNGKIVIIGDGPEKDNLLRLSKELNIKDFVLFAGKVPEEDLLKWYSLADIFVLPSLSEGRPTVINEAMASECAIVATNVSGIPEQVNEGYNGFLVEPKNADMIAERINYLLDDESQMVRMGQNSRKRIIDEGWTWEGYAKKVMKVYEGVVG